MLVLDGGDVRHVGRPDDVLTVSPPPASDLSHTLRQIVGSRHVLTSDDATRPYRTGYRFGAGPVAAVVLPGSLVEQWRVLQACVAARHIVILQAANTGLTGGSTPEGDDYDRGVVIISTVRLVGIHLIDGGRQAVCLPGATLYDLERRLKPLEREPHSVIGSSCIGASVMGGVCNNSGGSLVHRGPAFTELAVFARVDADGTLRLVNHLDIALGTDPEEILSRLDRGDYRPADIGSDPAKRASDCDYINHVRDIDADTPARFNADPRRLFEAAGSAGRLAVFAVRLDTFPKDKETAVFYIGTNDAADLTRIRRDILSGFAALPVAGEYIHRDAFDIAARYGKDTFLAIRILGTDRLPLLFKLKARVDDLAGRFGIFGPNFSDHFLQRSAALMPRHLPRRMRAFRNRFEHHLVLKVAGDGIAEARDYLARLPSLGDADQFECTPYEATSAFLHRFAVAGAAVRYRAIHHAEVEDIVSLDVALPRNAATWNETLPPDMDTAILHKLYYGHFFCHVFHQDYVVAKGHDPVTLEHRMWSLLDERRARYPAEHNVGHLYVAASELAAFYRELDPCNQFNPGIGRTSKLEGWRAPSADARRVGVSPVIGADHQKLQH